MILVDILVWLLIALGILLGLLLIVPVQLRLAGEVDDEEGAWWHARFAWGFVLFAFEAGPEGGVVRLLGLRVWSGPLGSDEDPEKKAAKDAKREEKRAKKKAKKRDKRDKKGQGERGLVWFLFRWRLLFWIFGRFVRAFHIHGRVQGVIGLPDPDQTAQVHRVLVAADAILPEGFVDVDVDWVDEIIALRGQMGAWVCPIQVLWIGATLLLSGETRRALRAPRRQPAASAATEVN